MYPVRPRTSFTATSSTFLFPLTAARAFRSSSAFAGMHAMRTPERSPRATRVLKTCSGGMPIFSATLGALRSVSSTEIELRIRRNACHEDAGAIAARHQGLEDLLGRHADLFRHAGRAQVCLIHRVFAQFVGNARGIQNT